MKPKRDFRITQDITMNKKKMKEVKEFLQDNIDTMAQLVYEINMMIKTPYYSDVVVRVCFANNILFSLCNR